MKKVWDLLMLLPTNGHMLEELSDLSTHIPVANGTGPNAGAAGTAAVHWDELLDSSSTFKLLYSLQIVDSLLLPDMTFVSHSSLPYPLLDPHTPFFHTFLYTLSSTLLHPSTPSHHILSSTPLSPTPFHSPSLHHSSLTRISHTGARRSVGTED